MISEGLGEVFKGDSADTCAGNFLLVSMGGRANGQACADGEWGPPSARAEIQRSFCLHSRLQLLSGSIPVVCFCLCELKLKTVSIMRVFRQFYEYYIGRNVVLLKTVSRLEEPGPDEKQPGEERSQSTIVCELLWCWSQFHLELLSWTLNHQMCKGCSNSQ